MSGINAKKLIAYQRTKTKGAVQPDYHMPIERIGGRAHLAVLAYGLTVRIAHMPLIRKAGTAFLTSSLVMHFMKTVSNARERLGFDLV